jgi:hypothetical protein
MQKYILTSQFLGYQDKVDQTNLPPGVLVKGSQNVLTNEGERIQIRNGYTLDGQANNATTPILSSYSWLNRKGGERQVRSYADNLEYRYVDSDGVVTWRPLYRDAGGFVNYTFSFAEFWDTAQFIDRLLFVNGNTIIYDWSGAVTTLASVTANTITKQGATTWGEEGFYTTGVRQVTIDGVRYQYTGGEGTGTLTGVVPDPTTGAHAVGTPVEQTVRAQSNSATTGLPAAFTNSVIGVLLNQVYVGSSDFKEVYVSRTNSFSNYSFDATRKPAQGAIFYLDAIPRAFVPQEEQMYISAGDDQWYFTIFQLSSDITNESLTIQRLKTNAGQGAQSQNAVSKIKNDVIILTNEPTLDTLGRLELINNPQSINISDPIKNDFDRYDFTSAQVYYYRDNVFIAIPRESLVLIYNLRKQYWEAPQVLPIASFGIIDGELYGHSSVTPETFKLFASGVFNDNGTAINAIARFSYQNFGDRANKKVHDEVYSEGYISSNTILTQTTYYDYGGSTNIRESSINGSNDDILFASSGDWSLGVNPLGTEPLGGGSGDEDELPPKFRQISTFSPDDYYEAQFQYSTNDVDQRWEILAFGANARNSTAEPTEIKI